MSLVSKERSSERAMVHFVLGSLFFPSILSSIKDLVLTATQWFLNWVFHLHRTRWESHLKENKFKTMCSFRTNCPSLRKAELFETLLLLLPHQVLSNSSRRRVFKVEILVMKWHLTAHSELQSLSQESRICYCIFSTLFNRENTMWRVRKSHLYFWGSPGETEWRLVHSRMSMEAWSWKTISDKG